ncbi:4'-phosphopantetheinyl transferase superfamily protein [Janthinobacterium lividum]|nr:4'-phosphopantetheinyl transferase superfamily protein [Janthinobacterium lividum]
MNNPSFYQTTREDNHYHPALRRLPFFLSTGEMAYCSLLEFDEAYFDVTLFQLCQIAYPAAIKQSVQKRQAEYFYGRLAARHALAPFGLDDEEIHSGPLREPQWPSKVVGSISHNSRYAGAVVLPSKTCGGIGIDIETVIDHTLRDSIISIALNHHEVDNLRIWSKEIPMEQLLTIVFSCKESFYKAAFPSVKEVFDFSAVEICVIDSENRTLQLRVLTSLCPTLPRGIIRTARFSMIDIRTVFTSCDWPSIIP